MVRVPLHGRRVGGWVVGRRPAATTCRSSASCRSPRSSAHGPAAEIIDLAALGRRRWGAGRLRPFLVAAARRRTVAALPAAARGAAPVPTPVDARRRGCSPPAAGCCGATRRRRRCRSCSPRPRSGPTLVVVPVGRRGAGCSRRGCGAPGCTVARAARTTGRAAAGGVDVVIGARAAAWAPCPDLAAIVVLDEHDEALQEERTPTWHARDVAIERAGAPGVPCCWCRRARRVDGARTGRAGVAAPDDRRRSAPGGRSSTRRPQPTRSRGSVAGHVAADRRTCATRPHRVVCVHNTPGRARLLACRSCRSLAALRALRRGRRARPTTARCAAGAAARCARRCASSAGRGASPTSARVSTRLREELEAAADRPVVAVTGATTARRQPAGVYVGTEAVLHRVPTRRRRRVPRLRRRAAGAPVPRRRAGDGAARARAPGSSAACRRRPDARADVRAPTRGAPGGAARRSGPAGRGRSGAADSCSACHRSARWPRQRRRAASACRALAWPRRDAGRRRRRRWSVARRRGTRSAVLARHARGRRARACAIEVDPPAP